MNVFNFVNSINGSDKKSLMEGTENDELAEKSYAPWIVNKTLSYSVDTIMYANEVNINNRLDSKLQYDYLRYSVRPRKRFSKWHKPGENLDLDLIKKHFNYNNQKAQAALSILTEQQLTVIRELYTGGVK